MEEEVCMFNKFGYCRFKEKCVKTHYQEICKENESCKAKNHCSKRHPKKCREYGEQKRIQNEASQPFETQGNNEIKEKVDVLEKSCGGINKTGKCTKG